VRKDSQKVDWAEVSPYAGIYLVRVKAAGEARTTKLVLR
jgi:hypothetical protein